MAMLKLGYKIEAFQSIDIKIISMFQCTFNSLLERKVQIRRPQYLENYLDFQFPPQIFREFKFQDFKDLNDEIIRLGLKIGFYRGRLFQRKDIEKSYAKRLIYTCKQKNCPAKLVYFWTGQNKPILCELFDNIHFHKKSSNIDKLKRQLIQQFVMDMPYSENWQNYKKWMYRFDINDKDAKFIVQQLFWYNNTENQIFSKMAFEGKIVRRIKDASGNTICVFIITESMKKNYQRFGEVINFDTTYRMIKKISPYGGQYGVGYFMAQDTNLRLVLTGICFYIKDEKFLLKQIFQFYFDLACQGKVPFAIFTDDVKPVNEAIDQIKKQRQYRFMHFYDWYHVTKNLRQQLQNQINGREAFQLFCKALGQCSIEIYNSIISEIIKLVNQKEVVEDFLAKQQKYCICKMPISNHNYGIFYRYSRTLNQRINQCTVFQTFTGRFFFTLLHFQKILERFLEKVTVINQGLIKHVSYEEIHMLTQKVQNQVMEQLFKYFKQSLDEDLILQRISQTNPLQYIVYSLKAQTSEGAKPRYYLSYSLKHGHWQCSCNIQYINGLPCTHIIKVMRQKTGGALQYYINTRWIHDKQDRIPEFSKPLISRKLRRV